ncbi:hypothetical protein NPX13_g8729 [Xylaria arbuscula]|uniref:Uncharacterized protein n=1 Tax=Xylaria arbuscula TaxID=114810 RepID=A0A9W8N875_9PEZI|nr:hypothetical protein NPX13_g8729 [Xylaria arbuscula]
MSSTPTNSTFISMDAVSPESSPGEVRTTYTGESRRPFRERIQRLRDRKGLSRLQRRDIPHKRASSSSIGNPPRTPPPLPMPVLISECPGAPRKGKVSELRRTSPLALEFKDILLDRKGIERAPISLDGCGDITTQGRQSPLRKSWGPDQPAETIDDLQPLLHQFAFHDGEKQGGVKKIFHFKGI